MITRWIKGWLSEELQEEQGKVKWLSKYCVDHEKHIAELEASSQILVREVLVRDARIAELKALLRGYEELADDIAGFGEGLTLIAENKDLKVENGRLAEELRIYKILVDDVREVLERLDIARGLLKEADDEDN